MKSNLMKSFELLILPVAAVFIFVSAGCKEDNPAEPDPGNPQELITKVVLTLTENGTGNVAMATFSDPDGDGGVAPSIGTLSVKAGSTYNGAIALMDESKNPPDDITAEIEEEADAHQFFYTPRGDLAGRVTVTITDKDSRNLPVGLAYTMAVTAGAPVAGTAANSLKVALSHYEPASAKDGTTPSSETDVEIDFPVNITN
jgi:hypothetical protein